MSRVFYTFLIFGVLSLSLWGCSESQADTPLFTTAEDRDTGFTPSAGYLTDQDGTISTEATDTASSAKQDEISSTVDRMKQEQEEYDSELDSALAGVGSDSFGSGLTEYSFDENYAQNSGSSFDPESMMQLEKGSDIDFSDNTLSMESSLNESEYSFDSDLGSYSDFSESLKDAQSQMDSYSSNYSPYSIDTDDFFSSSQLGSSSYSSDISLDQAESLIN